LWIHAASVGESLALVKLVKTISTQHPDLRILFTTMTPTGAQMVKQQLGGKVTHCYLPFDWRGASRRFIKTFQPRCALIMETELWPNLYTACAEANIDIVIINGRLSDRTLNARPWIKQLYARSLSLVKIVLARSQRDADAFASLGMAPEKIKVVGNIKFSSARALTDIQSTDLARPYVLLASTHADEEYQVARLWLDLPITDTESNPLLVIAPRHPKRSASIQKQLKQLNCKLAVRSRNDRIEEDTTIYLADTLGELANFMASADLIIMGGSFIPKGGQNILEPAMLGKPIIFGPYMHNFIDEAEGLLTQQAAIQADDYRQLLTILPMLLADPAKRTAYGDKARLFMRSQENVLAHYIDEINRLCDLNNQAVDQ
jgi:3-deoxy-D-manno-octulosonic-acid transferase